MMVKALPCLLALILFASCGEKAKTEPDRSTAPLQLSDAPPSGGSSGATQTSWDYCFASRTPAPADFGEVYNYTFTRLHFGKDGKVTGTVINAPYGTDGSRGSLTGVYREEGKLVQTTTTFLAEGELYEEQRDYRIGEDGLSTLNAEKEAVFTIPTVPCEQYEAYMKEYDQAMLRSLVNTTDRSRLLKVAEVSEFGYNREQLEDLRFMELPVDLDNNYETREYLLYIMDPMVCGSGGCNLLVIDGNGKTLSSTTVVKLPIYMANATVSDLSQKGSWKPLYVWSQGYRKLEAENGRYTANASMATEVSEEALTMHPEKFRLVLDYLD